MNNNFFSSERKAFFFVIEEFFLVFLIVFQLFFMAGVSISESGLVFFQNQIKIQNLLWFFSTTFFFITVYFGIAMRDKKVIMVHKEFSKLIFGTAKQKIFGMDREVISLLFFEFLFAIIIAFSIYIYLDPEVNFVPWPFNYVGFFALLAFGLFIFSKTKLFREAVYGDSLVKRKILPAERLTKRITNKQTGSIRIKSKDKFIYKKSALKSNSRKFRK